MRQARRKKKDEGWRNPDDVRHGKSMELPLPLNRRGCRWARVAYPETLTRHSWPDIETTVVPTMSLDEYGEWIMLEKQ